MRSIARAIAHAAGKVILALVVGLLGLAVVLPAFLDRIYYDGPKSDHYDGARFFNPGQFSPGQSPDTQSGLLKPAMIPFLLRSGRMPWPDHVAVAPGHPLPRVEGARMRATWIGHSTVLVQTQGLNILTDPIWADRTGPFGRGPQRVRSPAVRFEALPKVDIVLLSHNHYDHLDLPTLERLWKRDRPLIVTGLGNDSLLAARDIPSVARDWGQHVTVRPDVKIYVERVHHWDSRWFSDRNRALWSGFTVVLPGGNLFFAGDTGMGDGMWTEQAARRGRIRLALIPIGAFEPRAIMADSHVDPEEAVGVFNDLGAVNAMAVHWGTFQLSDEAIDAPPVLLRQALDRELIARGRFRTVKPGQPWDVPLIADFQRVSGSLQ